MNIQIEVIPKDQDDNEYATPCWFNFDSINDANNFIRMVLMHGEDIMIKVTRE